MGNSMVNSAISPLENYIITNDILGINEEAPLIDLLQNIEQTKFTFSSKNILKKHFAVNQILAQKLIQND
jgi:hypothetical protein